MSLPNYLKGLAGEYAVASELCRKGLNAAITMGNRKTVDIIAEDINRSRLIQVKTKFGNEWPSLGGVRGEIILVLVDFQGKEDNERADFYILNADDWNKVLSNKLVYYKERYGEQRYKEADDGVVVWMSKSGKPNYRGIALLVEDVIDYKEKWKSIKS